MDIKVDKEKTPQHDDDDTQNSLPLLQRTNSLPDTILRSNTEQVINQTLQGTADLARRLPTGTVLTFQLLAPVFTNQGTCNHANKIMTTILIALCGMSCFLCSFTDSFKDKDGNVAYGFATFKGLWIIDGSTMLPLKLADKYRLRFIDFVHAITSLLCFMAIAIAQQNTVQCFFPAPSANVQQVLIALPVGIGALCSLFFVLFPTWRHGIGFPLTK